MPKINGLGKPNLFCSKRSGKMLVCVESCFHIFIFQQQKLKFNQPANLP